MMNRPPGKDRIKAKEGHQVTKQVGEVTQEGEGGDKQSDGGYNIAQRKKRHSTRHDTTQHNMTGEERSMREEREENKEAVR